jgi:hypothetical protein
MIANDEAATVAALFLSGTLAKFLDFPKPGPCRLHDALGMRQCPLCPPKADIGTRPRDVCFVPKMDIPRRASSRVSGLVDARLVERSAKLFNEVASRRQIGKAPPTIGLIVLSDPTPMSGLTVAIYETP